MLEMLEKLKEAASEIGGEHCGFDCMMHGCSVDHEMCSIKDYLKLIAKAEKKL